MSYIRPTLNADILLGTAVDLAVTPKDLFNNVWFLSGSAVSQLSNFGTTTNFDIPFIQNGTEIMRMTSTGLGIGTVSPNTKLEVNSGSAGVSGLRFTNLTSASSTGTGSAIGVDSSGNVIRIASGGNMSSFTVAGTTGSPQTVTDGLTITFRSNTIGLSTSAAATDIINFTLNSILTSVAGTTYATGDLIYATGSTGFNNLADVATGSALISGGVATAPSWGKIGLTTHVSGILPAVNGGTSFGSYTVGDIIYASGATALAQLNDVATGNVLISGGVATAPSWGKVGLTTHVTGILPVANGGTNLSSGNSGGVLAYTASGVIASSAALTLNAIVLGGGAGAVPSTPVGLGTTTTVLHGNASGAPTWSAISMTTDVTGILPAANGGTSFGSYTVGDIIYASGATALGQLNDVATGNALISGGVATAPTWGKIGLTTHVSGILPIANGGTNSNLAYTAFDNLSLQGTNIASAGTTDLSTATGNFVFITGTSTITALGTATAGIERTVKFTGALTLTYNSGSLILPGAANITTAATDTAIFRSLGSGNWICISYVRNAAAPISGTNTGDQTITLTSDVTGSGTGSFATTIAANAVTFAKFQQLTGGLSVVGVTGNSTANVAAIAGTTDQVLRINTAGTALAFGAINLAAAAAVSGILGVSNGGTSYASYSTGDMLYASGATTLSKVTIGANNTFMRSNGTFPAWASISTSSLTDASNIALLNATQNFTASNGFNVASPLSTVDIDSAVGLGRIRTVTVDTTAQATDCVLLVNNTGATATITLPAAATVTRREYQIKKISMTGGFSVIIDPNGSETIDGALTYTIGSTYTAIRVKSDGTSWYIL